MANVYEIRTPTRYEKNNKVLGSNYFCDQFQRLQVSALTRAAEISPLVREVTIGPNSSTKATLVIEDRPSTYEDLTEDNIGTEFKHMTKSPEYDSTTHHNSEVIFQNLVEKMIAKRTDIMRKYWTKQTENSERRALELRSRKLQMLKELQDSDNLSVLENAKLDEQNQQYVNRKTIENMNKILEEQNIATARFAAITDSHTKICLCYNEINDIIQNNEIVRELSDKYTTLLNSVICNINALMDSCKSGSLSEKDVKQAEVLVINIYNIKNKLNEEIEVLKREECLKKDQMRRKEEIKLLHEKVEKQDEEKRALQKLELEKQTKMKPLFYSPKNYSYFEELKHFITKYESQYSDLMDNPSLKKFRFDCQKAVNTPVNAISSVSGIHMRDKYEKLSKLLKGGRVQVLDTYVIASQHPQGLAYCMALLAKKIVRQGDLLVSSNPEAAFPLASVTVALLAQFPDLAKLLEANFYRDCPYLVPMFLPQVEGQSDQDFYKSRGYLYNEDGAVEKQDKFLKRMSGIFRLRCAIWITVTPKFLNAPNPQGLQCAWRWLSSFINLKPEPDISATLLYDFLIVCGSEFYKHYGKQFSKIIKLILTDYLVILENIDEGGPKTRLEVYLQNVLKTGHIPPPKGFLPSNTW